MISLVVINVETKKKDTQIRIKIEREKLNQFQSHPHLEVDTQ